MATEKQLFNGGSSGNMTLNRRDFYPEDFVHELIKDTNPFMAVMKTLPRVNFDKDKMFKMFEHRPRWQYQTIYSTGGATVPASDATVSLTIDVAKSNGQMAAFTSYLVGHVCDVFGDDGNGNPAGTYYGQIVITTFSSVTAVLVKDIKAVGFSIPNPAVLLDYGPISANASLAPTPTYDNLKTVWNQGCIVRSAIQVTEDVLTAKLRGEKNEYYRLLIEDLNAHYVYLERIGLFGASALGTNLTQGDTFTDGKLTDANGEVLRSTYGALRAALDYGTTDTTSLDQSIFDIPIGSYSYPNFVEDSYKWFKYSALKERPLFSAYKLTNFWNAMGGTGTPTFSGRSNWNLVGMISGDKQSETMGFNYRAIQTPHGVVKMIPLTSVDDLPPWAGHGFMPDLDDMGYADIEPTRHFENIIKDNNPLYQKDEHRTQFGLAMNNIIKHKVLRLA